MSLKLVHLESDDEFEALVRCGFAAFEQPDCRLLQLFWPVRGNDEEAHEEAVQEASSRMAMWHHADPTSRWIKVIDDSTGEVHGCALWHVYEQNPNAAKADEEMTCYWFPEGEERQAADTLMMQFQIPRATVMNEPYVFLDIMYTHPDARRKGVGSLLMDWGVQEADRRGLSSFINATALGKELYKKYDYVEGPRYEFSIPESQQLARRAELEKEFLPFEWWIMYRHAGGKQGSGKLPWERASI